ncbi:FAD:protein FMN transferase [Flavisphingomonas formosensis]|uniref:FAD:protein FMN transferase n=1 Tax=Flavisphingomonas formosensis TaxID=861534 RepID=UPI0012F8C0C7|nr:FAD:protein FMN transferase [Sphingomonas formosensis]
MGTRWSLACVLPGGVTIERIAAGVQAALDRVVAQMSNWEADSDLSRFNRAPAGSAVTLPGECLHVLETGLAIARATRGAFDPTLGALVDLWGFGPAPAPAERPSEDMIAAALTHSGWERLTIDRAASSAVQPGGISLDFSGIAKGFGVDLAADWLKRSGICHFLIEVGGELRGEGVKPDGSPWWVEIESPPGLALEQLRIALHGLAIATSGDYRRFSDRDGRRLPHSLDPRTGRPIVNGVASVSVVHPSCTAADAFATALTVLGPGQGMAFATRLDLAAVIVTRNEADGTWEDFSPALKAMLD